MAHQDKSTAYRIGLIVLLILLVLLITEFTLSGLQVPAWVIYIFVITQAGVIIWEYMHVSRLLGNTSPEDQDS